MHRTMCCLTVALCCCGILGVQPIVAEELAYSDLVASIEAQNQLISQLLEQDQFDENVSHGKSCCNCAACCCPGWTVTAEAMFIERSRPDGLIMAREVFGIIAPVLNATDFELGFETGPRVSLTRHTRTGCDLQLTYFGIDGWNDTIFIPGELFIPTGGGNFFLGTGPATFRYQSQLHSAEMNVTSPYNHTMKLLAGFRWMELNERFSASIPNNPDLYAVESDNHLYGLQIGGIITPIRADRFWAELKVVGGAYHNNMLAMGTIFDGSPVGRDQKHDLAFVGELALTGICQFTDRLALRAGYQLMLIDNVAIATDQITTHDTSGKMISVVDRGSLLYHGGFGGLEWTW